MVVYEVLTGKVPFEGTKLDLVPMLVTKARGDR